MSVKARGKTRPAIADPSALAATLGAELSAADGERLAAFGALAETWGKRIDLTSARDPAMLSEILFLDALVLRDPALVPEGARLVDVGAGVGAPTIPLLLLREDLSATLIEPRRKRVAFLRSAIGSLGLAARALVVEGKVADEDPVVPGPAPTVALSRATFAPPKWLRLALAIAPRALVLTAQDEPPACPEGVRQVADASYTVPRTGAPRRVTAYAR